MQSLRVVMLGLTVFVAGAVQAAPAATHAAATSVEAKSVAVDEAAFKAKLGVAMRKVFDRMNAEQKQAVFAAAKEGTADAAVEKVAKEHRLDLVIAGTN